MRESSISDQKRLVRAEHWRHARGFLRARDKVHHRDWRLLTIAGPAPQEEIACIRALMPRAHITSVDLEERNVIAAIDAGADEVFVLDIGNFRKTEVPSKYNPNGPPYIRYDPPLELDAQPFDVICLDLTGPADDWLKHVVQVYFRGGHLTASGVMILTFSYGRDVVEVYQMEWDRLTGTDYSGYRFDPVEYLNAVPAPVAARIWYVLRSLTKHMDSCLQYRGGMMPMVSCLLRKGPTPTQLKFASIAPSDYELAVTAEDAAADIFACPTDRLAELRARYGRRLAARKAVETRRLREAERPESPQLRLITKEARDG